MRKRLTAWLLALVMALTLVGCRDDVTVIGVTTGSAAHRVILTRCAAWWNGARTARRCWCSCPP